MVSRCEKDLLKIKAEFKKKYGKSLSYFISVSVVYCFFISYKENYSSSAEL